MTGIAQAVDQIAAKVRAHRMTVRWRAMQWEGFRVRMRGFEPEDLEVDELGNEFFLVFA